MIAALPLLFMIFLWRAKMPLILHDIFCSIDEGPFAAGEKALKKLGLPAGTPVNLAKASIDARGRDIRFVCSAAIDIPDEQAISIKNRLPGLKISLKSDTRLEFSSGDKMLNHRPVVVGFGPAGMFAALSLAMNGYRPIVIERGSEIDERSRVVDDFWSGGKLDPETNVQFGEGGAGAFSDGKLTTRIGDERCDWILNELVKFGAPEEILYKSKPHVGTDLLVSVVKKLRAEVIRLGGEVRFNTKLISINADNGELKSIVTSDGEFPAEALILAIGHSARDSFASLFKSGLAMLPKPFSVGVRIEHLQSEIDRALYGKYAGHPNLWHGEYQLSVRQGEEACYTFCMCPGGQVVAAASADGQLVTNGMSRHARNSSNANSALAVAVNPAGANGTWHDNVSFQQKLEEKAMSFAGGKAPAQSVGLFLKGRGGIDMGGVAPSYPHGVSGCDFDEIFSPEITAMMRRALPVFGKRLRGFDADDAVLTGVETRTSSPLRMPRGEDLTATGVDGLYPSGEGAGYAGGIMSAAVDGIKVAGALMARFSRPV